MCVQFWTLFVKHRKVAKTEKSWGGGQPTVGLRCSTLCSDTVVEYDCSRSEFEWLFLGQWLQNWCAKVQTWIFTWVVMKMATCLWHEWTELHYLFAFRNYEWMNEWNQCGCKRRAVCVRLALNTTPAIVVPVFRGFGTWRLSKWPSKAEFLLKDTMKESQTGQGSF